MFCCSLDWQHLEYPDCSSRASRTGKKGEPRGGFQEAHVKSWAPYLENSLFHSPYIAQLGFAEETRFLFLSFMDHWWIRFIFTVSCLLTCGQDFKGLFLQKTACVVFLEDKYGKKTSPGPLLHCPQTPLHSASVLAQTVSRKGRKMWKELRDNCRFFS